METVLSKDGTLIAYHRSGAGEPLVLVHGTLGSHQSWATVLSELEKQFSVYAIDRRGYDESGDAPAYALEREYEDVVALVDSIGAPVNLFGHSFGGLCVLGAALRTPNLCRLIIYEPSPLPVPGASLYPEGVVERIQAQLDAGDREAAVLAVFRELLRVPPEDLDYYKASPRFPAWMAAAHLVPRETVAEENYRFEPDSYQNFHVPTLLMLGSESPDFFRRTIDTWHAALPNSRIAVLDGQEHLAHYTAPELFLQKLREFIASSG